MDLTELQNAYKLAIWEELLPDVLVGFGVIIPLLLAAAWVSCREEMPSRRAGFRFDFIAALALCAWLGYFVGQRLVFMMERPDLWTIGTLIGTAVCTFALLPGKRENQDNTRIDSEKTTTISSSDYIVDLNDKIIRYFDNRPKLKHLLASFRYKLVQPFFRKTMNSAPILIRGVAVFCLASSISTYSFLTANTKVVIKLKKPIKENNWPTFGTCYLGKSGFSDDSERSELSGKNLPYRATDFDPHTKLITLWLHGLAAETVGAPGWKISMTFPKKEEVIVNQKDIAMNNLALETQGLMNSELYTKTVKIDFSY